MMTSQEVPIASARDLINARNMLRRTLTDQNVRQPRLYARATAVITAMAELILKAGANGIVEFTIVDHHETHIPGIQLGCRLEWLGGNLKALTRLRQQYLTAAQAQIMRVTKDVECSDEQDDMRLTARIWLKEEVEHDDHR